DLGISEVNYHPLAPTAAELAAMPGVTAEDFEFIEIQNVSGQAVNLFEARFAEGSPFAETKLEPLSLAPGAFALVVKNRAAFALRHGSDYASRIVGEWKEGTLSDNGEQIRLLSRDGATILDFTYDDGGDWPGRADGKGASLEYTGLLYITAELENGNNWRSSGEFHGSPGTAGTGLDNRIVINEIFANSPSPRVDAIELFNPGGNAVDISGWFLSDEGGPETIDSFRQFQIPDGTVLQPGEYRVFTEAQFNPNGAWNPAPGPRGPGEFALDAANGDDIWLLESDANGVPIKVVDYQSIGATRLDESWGRWPNGTGKLVPLAARTLFDESVGTLPQPGLGARNSDPRIGPLVISEIHHSHPTNPAFEFVEFRNPTEAAQSLNGWRVRGAIDFDFAPDATIPAGGLLVLVPFSPAEEAVATAFRLSYGIDETVTLVGPWSAGDTLTGSGRITLQRALPPQPAEPGVIPRDVEDEANYRSNAAWPQAFLGLSLNRVRLILGDLPDAWRADVPTPGDTIVTYTKWKTLFFPNGGEGSGDGDDPDFDGLTNFGEYSWGFSPHAVNQSTPGNPSLSILEGELVFTYEKPLNRPGTQYQAQISEDLEIWTPVEDEAVSVGLDTEIRQFTMPFSDEPPRLFFRAYPTLVP
ncbi:MAG: lamin tail domain-containing protein, partial [Chthoniobacteraceae bacterium]